jgi:hypothetical protein
MNIISRGTPETQRLTRSKYEGQSGVVQRDGGWVAIRDGRYIDTFKGKRAFLAATRAAGTSRRLPA